MTESWFNDGIRGLFATIDRAVFSLISTVYEILLQISKVKVFGDDAIAGFATKIYGLLGIIMLFKITFSFITYLVNPDDMSDKSKGAHKIILNVLVVLAMIIIAPTAFNKLYEAQDAILNENLLSKFILGTEGDSLAGSEYKISPNCDKIATTKTSGDYISLLVFRPFFQLEQSDEVQQDESYKNTLDQYCNIGDSVVNYGTVSKYLVGDIYNRAPGTWNGMYMIDYKFFISTIVGIVVLLVLVSFCFDIAVRSLKLSFLQIIAPVPIISYIDPKSGKNGIFSKWLKEVGKTWADIFIRLAALFFGIYAIQAVTTQQSLEGLDTQYKFWVDLFLIIGALIFAKKLPKLLENILGIKIDSGFTLNPMKKIRDQALGGKFIGDIPKKTFGLGAGLAGGMIAGGVAGAQVGAPTRGILLGAYSGARNGIKNPKEAFTKSMREGYKDLTGNEMARLSLSKVMLAEKGKAAVQQTKDDLKIAYDNLNKKQTDLNISENYTASLAEKLRNRGFDISNIDEALKDAVSKQESQLKKVNELKENASKFNKQYAAAMEEYQTIERGIKSGIVGADGKAIYSQTQLEGARVKMEQAKNEYTTKQSQLHEEEIKLAEYKQAQEDISTYSKNKSQEEELRQTISDINRDIETIKSEKAKRERFYHVNKSQQKDYKKAVQDEFDRKNGKK